MSDENTASKEENDYRERYEQLLGELGRLEDHDQEVGGLLKLTLTRVLFAVDKAYPELADAAARIRDKARKQDDHAFEAGRIKVEVEELAKRIRELEARQPSAAECRSRAPLGQPRHPQRLRRPCA